MAWTKWCHEFSWHKCDCTEGTCSKLKEFYKIQPMARAKKTAPEKEYIVMFQDSELWVVGSKQDIIDDFNRDPDMYVKEANNIKIYELPESIPFSFITPQINF